MWLRFLKIKIEKSCGLKILEKIRIAKVIPYIKGKLLDIGCGYNNLVANYCGEGLGVDVFNWPGVDIVVGNTAKINLPDEFFDTIVFLASLNHIPNREEVLKEAYRLLKPGGRVLITMIPQWMGRFWHLFFEPFWGERKKGRNFDRKELGGMDSKYVIKLIEDTGLFFERKEKFMLGINNLFISQKPSKT